jgi:hypothetical protein
MADASVAPPGNENPQSDAVELSSPTDAELEAIEVRCCLRVPGSSEKFKNRSGGPLSFSGAFIMMSWFRFSLDC